MKKIAIIVHRFEKTIGSGAEDLAMQYAQRLRKWYDVEIFSTTCLNADTWANELSDGVSEIGGLTVRRFPTVQERDNAVFPELSCIQADKINRGLPTEAVDDYAWIEAQGPNCPTLLQWLQTHHEEYEAFLFVTYIYYHTVRGLPLVADKAIFFPTAHDELWIRQSVFQDIFSQPSCFGFLTQEEDAFVRSFFHNEYIPGLVVGCGVAAPRKLTPQFFRKKFGIKGDYLVYVGRIEAAKNCDQMMEYFIQYKKKHPSDLTLVMMGRSQLTIPKREDIIATGFVSDQEKWDGIAGARLMIAPSPAESLCIALLEGFAGGAPALVNGQCAVLREHCAIGNCGYAYQDANDFEEKLDALLSDEKALLTMSENAQKYVANYFCWDSVMDRLRATIEYVAMGCSKPLDAVLKDIQKSSKSKQKITKIPAKHKNRNILEDNQCCAEVIKAFPETAITPCFDDAVTVLFVSSNFFSAHVGVLIQSIISNSDSTRNYELLIMETDISNFNMNRLMKLVEDHENIKLRFVDVNQLIDPESFVVTGKNYDYFTFYRLLLPHLMRDYKKVLYLDADMLANADIAELYDEDVEGFDMAGTCDITVTSWLSYENKYHEYFTSLDLDEPGKYMQAGVILFNIAEMNRRFTSRFLVDQACTHTYLLNDQDLLNIHSKGHIRFLPLEWDVFALSDAAAAENKAHLMEPFYSEYTNARTHPKLIHYTEKQFPDWKPGSDMGDYYWKYARSTPFYEEMLKDYLISNMSPKKPE